jgi:glycosyltransferase involved in cell wall biosynthesis
MRVAYLIQNVGNIDFNQDLGDTVPVKSSLLGLQKAGHVVDCYQLRGQAVVRIADVLVPEVITDAPLGFTGSNAFRGIESGVRYLQKQTGLPYFAFIDSYRFYEGCMRILPGYDLCHEHNGLFSIGASLACSRLKIPFILTFSADPIMERKLVGNPLKGVHEAVARKEMSFSLATADRIICVSNQAKEHLEKVWQVAGEKIAVMPNGVDIKLFSQIPDKTPLEKKYNLDGKIVIGFVGGFQHWHGLDLLVESFSQVLLHTPSAQLLFVGDGPARENIETLVEKRNIKDSVKFAGLVPQESVPEYLSVIDVAVLPYPQLPKDLWFSPLKLYEYMAAGKAIVATNAGQIAEVIIDGSNGLLVPPGDIDEMAAALIRLVRENDLRNTLGQNAQQQAIKRHSWQKYIERLEGLYADVLDQALILGEQQGEAL